MKLVDALDGDDRRARAGNARAHLVEHIGEVHDLGLAGGVVDNGGAAGLDRRHDQVLRGADARELQRDRGPLQPLRSRGVNIPMVGIELDAESLEAEDVHIDLASAQVATTGHGNLGTAKAAEQRTHDGSRGAHLGHELVRGLPRIDGRGVDGQRMLVNHLDNGTHALEHLAHNVHVRDVRHVLESRFTGSQKRGRHELERGVLCTRNTNAALDCVATLNADDVQTCPFQKIMPGVTRA